MPRLMIFGGGPRRVFAGVSALGTSSASFSFADLPLGDAALDRMLAIGVTMGTTGTNFTISGVTVAGNAAASVVDLPASDTILKTRQAIYRLSLAAGETGTVAVTFGGSVGNCQVGVWAVYGLQSATPAFTASDDAIDGNPVSTSIDVPATGILLTVANLFGAAGLQTLSGAVVDDMEGANNERQWASYQAGAPEVARALGFSGSGNANSARTLVAASWS